MKAQPNPVMFIICSSLPNIFLNGKYLQKLLISMKGPYLIISFQPRILKMGGLLIPSLEMGGFKDFQDPFEFTCCIGTGMENHSKYGRNIFYHNENELFVFSIYCF